MMVATAILRARVWEEGADQEVSLLCAERMDGALILEPRDVYVSSTQPDSAIRVIRREVEKIKSEPVGAKELRDHLNLYVTLEVRTETP